MTDELSKEERRALRKKARDEATAQLAAVPKRKPGPLTTTVEEAYKEDITNEETAAIQPWYTTLANKIKENKIVATVAAVGLAGLLTLAIYDIDKPVVESGMTSSHTDDDDLIVEGESEDPSDDDTTKQTIDDKIAKSILDEPDAGVHDDLDAGVVEKEPTPLPKPPRVALTEAMKHGKCFTVADGHAFRFDEDYEVNAETRPYRAGKTYRLDELDTGIFVVKPWRQSFERGKEMGCAHLTKPPLVSQFLGKKGDCVQATVRNGNTYLAFKFTKSDKTYGFKRRKSYFVGHDDLQISHIPVHAPTDIDTTNACYKAQGSDFRALEKVVGKEEFDTMDMERRVSIEKGRIVRLNLGKFALGVKSNKEDMRKYTVPTEIGKLTGLRVLELYDNAIDRLPDSVCDLTRLRELRVGTNNLQVLPYCLGKLKRLRILSVSENRIEELPDALFYINGLQELYAEDNKLRKVPARIGNFADSLRVLSLGNNDIEKLPAEFTKLRKLERLGLYGNRLESLPENIDELQGLYVLNVRANFIEELPQSVSGLRNLRVLNASDNELVSLPEYIGHIDGLRELYFGGNDALLKLPDSIARLTNLRVLQVGESNYAQIPANIRQLPDLELTMTRN